MRFSCPRPCRRNTPARYGPRTAPSWSHRLPAAAAGSTNSSRTHSECGKHRDARRLQRPQGQHDDLARLPRARSRQGGDRRSPSAWHGSGPPRRPACRMVPPAPDARASSAIAPIRTESLPTRSPLPGNGFSRPEKKAPKRTPEFPIDPWYKSPKRPYETRQLGAFRRGLQEISQRCKCVVADSAQIEPVSHGQISL